MTPARAADDAVFGDAAIALAPRALNVSIADPLRADRIAVELDPRGLDPADRATLARLDGARVLRGRSSDTQHELRDESSDGERELRDRSSGSEREFRDEPRDMEREFRDRSVGAVEHAPRRAMLVCRRAELAALRPRTAALDAILAAHDNAKRKREPVRVMGIVNVTPDSFSESSRFPQAERAIEHGLALVAEGASFLDVGGESTRPGASPIAAGIEIDRVVPVIRGLARAAGVPISVDTTKAAVAEAALDAGASIVNDVSAGRFDPRMLALVAARRAGFVAMHMQGTPLDMQADPAYADVMTEVTEFLRARARACLEAGIDRSRVWVDPGIGFGKHLDHNLDLVARLAELRSLGLAICLGASRKSFIAAIERRDGVREPAGPDQRIGGTAAASAIGVWNGASILRVHDVRLMVQATRVAEALARREPREPRAGSCSIARGEHNHRR